MKKEEEEEKKKTINKHHIEEKKLHRTTKDMSYDITYANLHLCVIS